METQMTVAARRAAVYPYAPPGSSIAPRTLTQRAQIALFLRDADPDLIDTLHRKYVEGAMSDLVPRPALAFDFQGEGFTALEYKGRPVVVAQELGRLLGYSSNGSKLTKQLREWGEHVEGADMFTLEGEDLAGFKTLSPESGPSRARHIVLLTESGITLALARSGKPQGRAFRRFLVDVVLPAFRELQHPPAAAAPPAPPPLPKRPRAPRRDTRGPATRYRNPANLPQEIAPQPTHDRFAGYVYKMSDLCDLLGLDPNMKYTLGKWMKAAGIHADPRFCRLVWADVQEPGEDYITKQRRYRWSPASIYAAQIILRKRRIAHAGYTPRAMVKA